MFIILEWTFFLDLGGIENKVIASNLFMFVEVNYFIKHCLFGGDGKYSLYKIWWTCHISCQQKNIFEWTKGISEVSSLNSESLTVQISACTIGLITSFYHWPEQMRLYLWLKLANSSKLIASAVH